MTISIICPLYKGEKYINKLNGILRGWGLWIKKKL